MTQAFNLLGVVEVTAAPGTGNFGIRGKVDHAEG